MNIQIIKIKKKVKIIKSYIKEEHIRKAEEFLRY
jgi:hypothetical protein